MKRLQGAGLSLMSFEMLIIAENWCQHRLTRWVEGVNSRAHVAARPPFRGFDSDSTGRGWRACIHRKPHIDRRVGSGIEDSQYRRPGGRDVRADKENNNSGR